MAEHLRKLTIKACGFSIADVKAALTVMVPKLDKENKPVNDDKGTPIMLPEMQGSKALLKIVGKTTEAKPGQTDKGEYLKLLGQFTAVNLITGEVFTASACILPNFISEAMGAALHDSQAVEFALEVGAKAAPDSVTGYEYTVRELIDSAPSDAMQRLLKAAGMADNVLKLSDATGADDKATGTDGKPAKGKGK